MTIARAEAILVGKDSTAGMFRSFVRNAETANKEFAQKFRATFSLITGGFIGQQIGKAIRESIQRAGDIEALAQAFSTTTEEISRLDYAAKQSNSSIDEVAGSFQRLFRSISLAEEGSKKQIKALDQLGLSSEQFLDLSLTGQIGLIADAWNKLENPQQKARIAQDLFSSSTTKIVPLLKRGSEGIRELAKESDDLGNTLTRETIQKLAEAESSMRRVEAATGALRTELAIGLGPTLVATNEFFTTAAKGARTFWEAMLGPSDPVGMLQEQLADLADRRNELLKTLRRLNAAPELVMKGALEKWEAELRAVEAEMNRVNSALQQFGRDAQAYENATETATKTTRELLAVLVTATKIVPGYSEALQKMFANTATDAEKAAESYRDFKAQLDILFESGVISAEKYNERLQAFLDKAIPEVKVTAQKIDGTIQQINKLSVFAEQAARNIQSYFADFLFDPFDKGIKGMLRGFIDVIRRMVAEAGAAQILGALGLGNSGGGFLGTALGALFGAGSGGGGGGGGIGTFKGFAAHGMTLRPGEFAIAGEGGKPEAVLGPSTIVPMDKMGRSSQRSTQIHAPLNISIRVDGSTDRSITQQQIDRTVRGAIGEYNEFWRDQLSRGAYA